MLNKTFFTLIISALFFSSYSSHSLEKHLEEKAEEMKNLIVTYTVPNPPALSKEDAKRLLVYGRVDDLVPLFKGTEHETAKQNAYVLAKVLKKPENYMYGPNHFKRFEVAFTLNQARIAITDDELHALFERECQFDDSFCYRVRDSLLTNVAMFDYIKTKQGLMQEIKAGQRGCVGMRTDGSLKKALAILETPESAYPELIERGSEFIKSTQYELTHSKDLFSDQSYKDPLYTRHEGISKHHQHIFWGLDAIENALRAFKKAETHFTQLSSRQIPFDHQFLSQLADLKGKLKQALEQAKGIPQFLIREELFVYRQEELLDNLQKRIQEVEKLRTFE